MEVLHGNKAGSKYSRRRSDRNALAENRLLDWGVHDSDIALIPNSPLALAEVLTQNGGYLDLVATPENIDTPSSPDDQNNDTQPTINTSYVGQTTQATRLRYNLLTNHSDADLLKQCKKILVENALTKYKGDRQLYLAAGFISWASTNDPDTILRAPLLLYPALLVRIPNEQCYEIRLAGDTPEFNLVLLQHLEQRHSCTLPAFDEDMPLADFFARVAESIDNTTAIELELDIALGTAMLVSAVPQENKVSLPKIPAHFDAALAISITGNKSLEHLTALLQLIPNFDAADHAEKDSTDQSDTSLAMSGVGRLRRYAAKLAGEGLDHIEFRQLPTLPDQIAQWTNMMALATATPTFAKVLKVSDPSTRQLIRISGIIELIDKAPNDIETWGHGDLCYANSTLLLRRAQHQAKLIEDELQALQEHFHLDKVPAKPQLLSLMSELGSHTDHEHELVDAEYFQARRQFMEFSTNKPTNLTAEHILLLSQLAKVLRFRELFVNNVEYRSALGNGYKGLRTDWPRLIRVSEYARELADVVGSETIAAAIISNWVNFRRSFVQDLESLQQSAEATRHLISTLGNRWQTQNVSALAAHALLIAGRLEEWKKHYGSAESHGDKSAATVLSSFSGPSMDHVLVETQVDETQVRIRQQLSDGDIQLEQVNDTVLWLKQASVAVSDSDKGIDAIVEHLQSV